jgi:hypothetical protein
VKAADRARIEQGGAEIMAIAGAYMWLDRVPVTYSEYVLDGIVKLPDTMCEPAPAAAVRLALLGQAEKLLGTLSDAGWQPLDEIRFETVTDMDRAFQARNGTVVIPAKQDAVSMLVKMRIGLEKYRPPAREIEIRQRSPQEVRERLLSPSSPIPRDVAEAFLEELERGD